MDRRQNGVRVRGRAIQIDFYFRGVRCREILRLPPSPGNLRHAEKKREAVLYAIELGTFEYAKFFPRSRRANTVFRTGSTVTIGELLTGYLRARERTVERSTYKGYKSAVEHHLRKEFGSKITTELKPSDIREWIAGLSISNKRINNVLIPLRGALADALSDGVISSNPAAAIPNLTHNSKEPDPFAPEEQVAILEHCDGAIKNLFQFAFWTGLRTSELIALQWFHVDFKKGVAHIRSASVGKHLKTPKTKSGVREVKLLPPALEALERQKSITFTNGGAVFSNPRTGKAWETDDQIRKTAWMPAVKRSGVRYRCAYQTRHTYASTMLSSGENPMWVANQMGHSDWGMIRKVYGRWIPQVDPTAGAKAMAAWSQLGHSEKASA